jgi:hypothetical protein
MSDQMRSNQAASGQAASHPAGEQNKTGPRKNEASDERAGTGSSIPAIRHVGPTLESDPDYLVRAGSGDSTPEARLAELAGVTEPPLLEVTAAEVDPLSGEVRRIDEPERLKTRLPGDTSSDPHTDVGPDNATTVQRRGEAARGQAGTGASDDKERSRNAA